MRYMLGFQEAADHKAGLAILSMAFETAVSDGTL
jgi:hypothetical protein